MSSLQPWIRQVELIIGPLLGWRTGDDAVEGPLQPEVVRIRSNGDLDSLRVRFTVHKHGLGTSVPTHIDVYNLSQTLRNALRTQGLAVVLNVGWQSDSDLTKIFSGNLQASYSRREGPDIITTLLCMDAGGALMRTYVPPPRVDGGDSDLYDYFSAPGTTIKDAVLFLAANFPDVALDPENVQIDDELIIGPGGHSYYGLVMDCLDDLARAYGFSWTVVNGAFRATMDGKPLQGPVVRVDSANGFLLRAEPVFSSVFQVPVGLIIQTMLDPRINPEGVIELVSAVNPSLTGDYMATTVVHSGDTHSTQWVTTSEVMLVGNAYA